MIIWGFFYLWPLDIELLQHFDCYVFKLCTKSQRNRIIRVWVIEDLACLRRAILGVEHDGQTVLRVRGPNLTKLRVHIGRSTQEICFSVRIFVAFSNAGDSKLITTPNFALFDPPLWKLGEKWAISLYHLLKLYLRPNLWWPSTVWLLSAVDWCKKKEKESSSVKLKVFRPVGRPNEFYY